MIRTAIVTLLALGLAAQTPASKPEAKPAPAPAKAASAAAAAPAAAKPDQVLAKIDGQEIRESDMDTMYENLAPQQRASMQGQGREKMVQNYVEFRLLVAKAHRLGLDKTPEHQKKLKLSGYQLMASELLRKESENLQKKTQVSDDDIKAYYEGNKDAFKTPGKFNARHILLKTKGGPNGEQGLTEEEALKKIAEIKAEFGKGGSWDDLAKKYSEDPGSKDKGGLYEGIAFGQFVPEFEAAVKKQEIGKIGEPVKSMFGFHLIQVETRGDSEAPAFDAVKEQVKQKATQVKQETVWKAFIDGLKKEIPVALVDGEVKDAKPAEAAKPAAKPAAKAAAAPAKKADGSAK